MSIDPIPPRPRTPSINIHASEFADELRELERAGLNIIRFWSWIRTAGLDLVDWPDSGIAEYFQEKGRGFEVPPELLEMGPSLLKHAGVLEMLIDEILLKYEQDVRKDEEDGMEVGEAPEELDALEWLSNYFSKAVLRHRRTAVLVVRRRTG